MPTLPLDVLDLGLALKELDRAGWRQRGLAEVESVAAHSWGMAWLALALAPPELDRGRLLALCALHDLAEVLVGDITPGDGVDPQSKIDRERSAAARILATRPDLWGLWEDYEKDRSDEAHFVHQLDKLDMALQALRYARTRGLEPAEFLASARRGVVDPALRALLEHAIAEASRG